MIDHMLVNLKKYYEGMFPCYIGMNIKAPKSSLPAYYMADSPVDGTDMLLSTEKPSLTPAELENKEVIAQHLNGLDDFYLLIQPAGDYSYINCWIKLSDLVKNGGVSHSLLNHVCHALILAGKEISMALEKMKYQLKDWYEGQVPNYIGMTIKAPQQNLDSYIIETFPNDTETIKLDHNNASDGNTASPDVLDGQIVQGQIALDADDCWLMIFVPATTGIYAGKYLNRWIKYTDLVQNGGGCGIAT